MNSKTIQIETVIQAPVAKVWKMWTEPEHIVQWCFASEDWEAPRAESDLREGGRFSTRMQAKDGSAGFDFGGVYTEVKEHESIRYEMDDARKVSIRFEEMDGKTRVVESFEMEGTHTEEQQRAGWQSILDNFKKHVEGQS